MKNVQKEAENGMYDLMKKLYPICRSLTGNGVRETLSIIKEHIPIELNEVKSGTNAFDWTVPKEWNITDAYVKDSEGKKIIDFKKSNLHIVNYSIPVKKKISLEELKEHLHTIPKHSDWIPYVTSYYNENWGFCLKHKDFEKLKEGEYEVVIDSSLKEGLLNYGELFIKGKSNKEVLFSTYLCHPSLCNDNLSGLVLAVFLAKHLLSIKNLKYSYRFLFIPETIGSIVWLNKNKDKVKNIDYGLVFLCLADKGIINYKKTRIGNAEIDRIVEKVMLDSGENYNILEFYPTGSDERQYCSSGFNLPVGTFMRTPPQYFPEYHTSADNLNFASPKHLSDSFEKIMETVYIIENNKTYKNLNPYCEPQLGKRNLYPKIGALGVVKFVSAMMWTLNLSDETNSLLDIAVRSKISFREIKKAADDLEKAGLLSEIFPS